MKRKIQVGDYFREQGERRCQTDNFLKKYTECCWNKV